MIALVLCPITSQLRVWTSEDRIDLVDYSLRITKQVLDFFEVEFDMEFHLPKLGRSELLMVLLKRANCKAFALIIILYIQNTKMIFITFLKTVTNQLTEIN